MPAREEASIPTSVRPLLLLFSLFAHTRVFTHPLQHKEVHGMQFITRVLCFADSSLRSTVGGCSAVQSLLSLLGFRLLRSFFDSLLFRTNWKPASRRLFLSLRPSASSSSFLFLFTPLLSFFRFSHPLL